jgi:hypothetical protein
MLAPRSLLASSLAVAGLLCGAAAWAVVGGRAAPSAAAAADGSEGPVATGPGTTAPGPFAWLLPAGAGSASPRPPAPAPRRIDVGATDPPQASFPGVSSMQEFPRECMPWKAPGPPREFHFTRGIYSSGGGGGFFGRRGRRGAWCTDHPKAEFQFLQVLDRLTGIDAHPHGNAVELDDPDLRKYPVLYMLEVGYMGMTQAEVEGLRNYLLAGGFLIIDDFWGTQEWFNFEREMARVFPEYSIVDLPMDHPVYRTYYQVDTVLQVPAVNRAWGGPTWERDGYHARNLGIFDDGGRLLVAINWNTDLGDAWEWMEQPHYPLRLSTYAYQVGVNYIVYAMSN